jgi:hypothetical protein
LFLASPLERVERKKPFASGKRTPTTTFYLRGLLLTKGMGENLFLEKA